MFSKYVLLWWLGAFLIGLIDVRISVVLMLIVLFLFITKM